jgi:hypothetical protein
MDEAVERLVRLQAADEQITALSERIAALPKHLAALGARLEEQRHALAISEKQIKDEEALRRRLDSDLKDQQQKLAKYREQLNGIKNNEQFTALQHEVAFAEQEIKRLEDTQVAGLERLERFEANRRAAQAALAEQSARVEEEQAAAKLASAEQEKQLHTLKAERELLRPGVDESLLKTYDRVSGGARRTGLARVQRQQCQGCQMYLRPQLWNQIRTGGILICESCGRLLYHDPSLEPPPPPKPEPKKVAKKRLPKVVPEAASAPVYTSE